MVTAAKTVSQVITHMSIAFGLAFYMTGSTAFGGLAAVLEPIINVILLPLHEKSWHKLRSAYFAKNSYLGASMEKISQTAMHMVVAFTVMYGATGSLAFGGMIAILEPIFNVVILPIHDRGWENIRARMAFRNSSTRIATITRSALF